MEFSKQEYWSGLPFPSPGDLLGPGIESALLASPTLAGRLFTAMPARKPPNNIIGINKKKKVEGAIKISPSAEETLKRDISNLSAIN